MFTRNFFRHFADPKTFWSKPTNLFWLFALSHFVLWTIIPILVCPNAPLDVIEGYVWGHEWLLGTYKHPPMQAWWLETLTLLTGQATWTYLLASQTAILLAFWAVWQMARRVTDEQSALISVLLLEGVAYYNFTSPEFNPNVLQLPFWALIGLFFHRAIKENKLSDWMLLGLWSAGGLYSKYSTGLLLMALTIAMILHPDARKRFKTSGFYIALLVTSLLFAPHIVWLFNNDFMPFHYAQSRLHEANSGSEYFMRPLRFLANQLLVIFPTIILFLLLGGRKAFASMKKGSLASFDRLFLNIVVFLPLIIIFLISLAGARLKDMWGTPLWGFLGIWIVCNFHVKFTPQAIKRFTYGWVAVFVVIQLIYITTTIAYPYMTHKSLRVYFPGQALSNQITAAWNNRYSSPFLYIIGDTWPAGNIAYYPPGRQHVLIEGNYAISPWINPDDIKRYGAVIVWCIENCACNNRADQQPSYVSNYPEAEIQPPITLRRQTKADIPPVKIGWAILPPAVH